MCVSMLLEVRKLNIEFYDHDVPERVVKDLDMTLDSGCILGIVGGIGVWQVYDGNGDSGASAAA